MTARRPLLATMIGLLLAGCALGEPARTIHLDPTAPAGGDGSLARPLNAWTAVRWQADTAYLQRRGTTMPAPPLAIGANGVILGAYGEGDRPRIESQASGRQYAISAHGRQDLVIRDLVVVGDPAAEPSSLVTLANCQRVTLAECHFSQAIWGVRATHQGSAEIRVIGCTIDQIGDDGIFFQNVTGIEIGWCRITAVNRRWRPPTTSQREASGDGIQLSGCDRWSVHHNVIDRSDSGNKFCFIANGEQTSGVFAHNHCRGPLQTSEGGASIYFNGGTGLVVRQNLIEGPSPGGIYHHAAELRIEGNVFSGLPNAVSAYTKGVCLVVGNLLWQVAEPWRGNCTLEGNREEQPTPELLRAMEIPGHWPRPTE